MDTRHVYLFKTSLWFIVIMSTQYIAVNLFTSIAVSAYYVFGLFTNKIVILHTPIHVN